MPIDAGYTDTFLGLQVPMPTPIEPRRLHELRYTHFTVLLDPGRRLAAVTGVNVDGDQLRDVERSDDWHIDARVPADAQAGSELYARNDLDRGHLVRRRDPVWGDEPTARRANQETFVYTNAAPQAADFNQGKELWSGLEDHVLEYARTWRNRISVFTAPVLATDDPRYRGIAIPRRFWKIAAWATHENDSPGLAAAGFVLDQTPNLKLTRPPAPGYPPPLGPFRAFQVPVRDIAALAGLQAGELSAADVLEPAVATRRGARPDSRGWVRIEGPQDILV